MDSDFFFIYELISVTAWNEISKTNKQTNKQTNKFNSFFACVLQIHGIFYLDVKNYLYQ